MSESEDLEIEAMRAMVAALDPCTREQRHRAIRWAEERYGATGSLTTALTETIAAQRKVIEGMEQEAAQRDEKEASSE